MTKELPADSADDVDAFPFTPLGQRAPETVPRNGRPEAIAPRISSVLVFFVTLMVLWFVVPLLAERVQYSLTRGRQRAEYDAAKRGLSEIPLANLSLAYQLVSKRIAPSVVHIRVISGTVLPTDEIHGMLSEHHSEGAGSGVIVDPHGYILTNNHVIENARQIEVTLSDDREVLANVVGTDPATDLALLKVTAAGLIAAEWGDSDQLETGALVWAVGSPFGFRQSITSGIISAKGREMSDGKSRLRTNYSDFLQTDAAVNPGNSGGPLVDVNGRVVGINTAIVGAVFSGASFAIPSRVAQRVYRQLRISGKIERGWLGVEPRPITEAADPSRLAVDHGAYVNLLVDGVNSPAAIAGIQQGDVIIRWDGQHVEDVISLIRLVALTKIGSQVDVVVMRGSQKLTFQVTVGRRPPIADQ